LDALHARLLDWHAMEPEGVAVVTGASRGIGRAVAVELARRGFETVATMRDPDDGAALRDEAAGLPGALRVERLDVTDPASIDLPDGLTVLVNNAGVETENLPIEHSEVDDQWRRMFETNVFGLVRVTQRAIPKLRANGGGVICNVTSSSLLAPVPFMAIYRASKMAVTAIGESLAAEVAQFGIRVVEIMPGPIITDMLRTSEKPAEGIRFPEYRALAESMWETRQTITGHYTPADEAARRIADAIVTADDPAKLVRAACDDMAHGMVSGWQATPHDTMINTILGYYAGIR
jgi:NAD(P)-dependent dehydrogenase (short-subunit alcohol dehydrogenase family)